MLSKNCCRLIFNKTTNLTRYTSSYKCYKQVTPSPYNNSISNSVFSVNNIISKGNSSSRYYTTTTAGSPPPKNNNNHNKKNNNDHKDLDSHEESLVDHNQEIFKRDPKGFWIVVGLVAAGVSIKLYNELEGSLISGIKKDINVINTSDDPQEKSEALSNILSRISYPFNIESLYKEGVVDALVKSVNDSDPAVQSIAIVVLTEFIDKGYDVFGEEAVRKGIIPIIAKNMLSLNMNSDASIKLWRFLLSSNNNHDFLLNSHVFLENLNSLAHSSSMHLQEVVVETTQFLFANRDNYHLLPKLKSILHHLVKSKNALISNYSEQYIGVLDGRLVPPVGTTQSKIVEGINSDIFRLHVYYNIIVGVLAFPYCTWRWKGLTNDVVYGRSRSLVGTFAILGAGCLASLGFIPVYHSKSINGRIRDQYFIPSYQHLQQKKKENRGIFSVTNNDTTNNSNSKNISTANTGNNNTKKEEDSSKSTTTTTATSTETTSIFSTKYFKDLFFTPPFLFLSSQLFPVVGNTLLLYGWRKSRYVFLPSLCVVIPYNLTVLK